MRTLSLFILLSVFIYSCKKSGGSSNNGGTSNQWFFKCNVDNIATNISGNGNSLNAFVGGSSSGSNGGPGITIHLNSECNTNASNPCLSFTANFEYLAVGKYTISDTIINPIYNNPLNAMILFPQNQSVVLFYNTTSTVLSLPMPITSVVLNITHVGSVGENISGNFSGTILKLYVANNNYQLIKISGSFNVDRLN